MAVNSTLSGLSQTAASNGPDGTTDAPSTLDDALRYHGAFLALIRDGAHQWLTSVAGTNTITGSCDSIASYAAGQAFAFVAAATNSGAATLNIGSIGAKSITKNGTTALSGGEIQSGHVVRVVYDGTQFQLQSLPLAPAFIAYAGTGQGVASGVETKVAIDTELYDTAGCFDASNYRFTPNVAGFYQVNGVVRMQATNGTQFYAQIYKNGAAYTTGDLNTYGTSTNSIQQCSVSDLVYLNGSTDYIELYGTVAGTSPAFVFGAANTTSRFSAALVRF